MLTDYSSHFSCRYFSWFQKSRQNYHSRSLAPAIRMCEQYTIWQGFSLQVPVYVCIHSLKKDPSHSALWLRIYIPRWPYYTLKTDRDWKTSYFCLDIQATIAISRNWIARFQGRIQKIQKGVAGTLSSYIDTLYFSENYIKIIKISNKKGCPRSRRPSPKSKKYHNTRCYPSKILYKHFFFNFS